MSTNNYGEFFILFPFKISELLSIEDEYKREMWQLSEGERTNLIPVLKEEGNELFRKGQHNEASLKYSEALGLLEQMMLREKPGEDEWNALNAQKLPLLLNFAQCKLSQGEFYSVIEHCNTVLTSEPGKFSAHKLSQDDFKYFIWPQKM